MSLGLVDWHRIYVRHFQTCVAIDSLLCIEIWVHLNLVDSRLDIRNLHELLDFLRAKIGDSNIPCQAFLMHLLHLLPNFFDRNTVREEGVVDQVKVDIVELQLVQFFSQSAFYIVLCYAQLGMDLCRDEELFSRNSRG